MTSEVTQADRDAAAPFAIGFGYIDGYSFSDSHLIRNGRKDDHALVQAFARHRLTAQSGEGRSGAGEDAEHLVRIFRGLPLHGDAGCDKLSDDEWRQVALAALNARQSGEGERDSAIDEIQSLRQRVERLERALRPFARIEVIEPSGHIVGLERYDFERARAALSPKVQEGE